jgi:ABC-type polysaccharide/polyol phosphate transport system ATPase subunit
MEGMVRVVCNRAICVSEGAILAEGVPAKVIKAYNGIHAS